MIDIHKLHKSFGKLQVLQDVNLTFANGASIALIGPNGCGKTTLIKSVLGMVIPDSGDIKIDGQSVIGEYRYRESIGYMPQIGRYPDNMTIRDIINTIKSLRNTTDYDEDLIVKYRLEEIYNKRMSTLSGGTRQKVSATLAFLFKPDILILDEPTAGLDPIAAEILKEKILDVQSKGKLVLITSHMLSELDDMVNQIVFMQDGCVRFHKSVEDLIDMTGEDRISKSILRIIKREDEVYEPYN